MSSTIAILGANGVYARHLIPLLTSHGFLVRGLARRPEAATVATACSVEVRYADLFDLDSLVAALADVEIALHLATSLPGPSGRGDFATNDRLRRDGTPLWVEACRRAGVSKVIQQSIALVHAAGGDTWSDESTSYRPPAEPTAASTAIDAALAMERAITESGLDWIILRGGLFYGPGTGYDDDWHQRAVSGRLRLPGDGSDYVSLVRIEDMAAATLLALRHWPSRHQLIVCDDEPARWSDVFGYLCASVGQAAPKPGGLAGFPSFRLRNRRAKEVLGWSPFYSNYRVGLVR
ncbi:MAG: NAD(P)-dependent oxidoreductase [Acidobacteriota bacterium]